jgi:hypothetical protein
VFDQLNEYMNDSGDLQQAMRRLMQKGIKRGENQTKGIDDLLSQVAREMRKLYDEYRLQSAMDEVQEQLESIVDQERHTLEELDQAGQDTQEKKQFLNNLPGKASEAVEKLTSYRFENTNAEKSSTTLMQLEQITSWKTVAARGQSLSRQTPCSSRNRWISWAHGGVASSGRPIIEHATARTSTKNFWKTPGGDRSKTSKALCGCNPARRAAMSWAGDRLN